MTVARVILRELDGIAELVGEAGNSDIVASGGRQFLRGSFALRLSDVQSRPTDLTAIRPEVVITGGKVVLRATGRSVFLFDPMLTIQRGTDDPWLAATRAALFLDAAAGSPLLLSLDDASLSVIPDLPPSAAQRFHFPTRNGAASNALTPINASGITGFFVVPLDEGGFGVRFGNLAASAALDHHDVTGIIIPRDTLITFRLGAVALAADAESDIAPQSLLLRGDQSSTGINVTLNDSTEGLLPRRAGGRSAMRCGRVEVGGGWLSVTEMHASQPDVAVARLHTTAQAETTKLVARPTRMRYHLPLARQDGTVIHRDAPHFAYRDADVETGSAAARPRDRHHGLRIRGLQSSSGAQAKLDANWAVAAVEAGKLQFRAGATVNVRGVARQGVVLPKVDPNDPERRTLAIPAGVAELRCSATRVPSLDASPIVFDTSLPESERLQMRVTLAVAPSGALGRARAQGVASAAAADDYSRWELQPPEPMMKLRVNDDGVFPADGEGWPRTFTGAQAEFALVEHPGSRLELNPGPGVTPMAGLLRDAAADNTTRLETVKVEGSAQEILVYSALSAVLILREKLFEYFVETYAANFEEQRLRVELQQLDDSAIFKNREVDSLLAVFCDRAPGGRGDEEIRKFILNNRPSGKTQLVWAFAPGLALLMWDQHGHAPAPFCFEIARDRNPRSRPGMAIDQSSIRAMAFSDFGWESADEARFRAEPLLWPRLARRTGAQLDPSDSAWRGVVFRDLPLVLAVNPNDVNESATPFVKRFYESLNERLMLDYGWKDETGSTWRGGFEDLTGVSITPAGWRSFLDIQILRFFTRGAAGRILGAEGELRVLLPRITSGDAQKRPLSFTGKFGINIDNGVRLEQIEFAPEHPEDFGTTSIPGFEKVEIVRFSSNLETMLLTLRLMPSPALAAALPFLRGGQALEVTSLVPLRGNGATQWSFTLRSEIQTNLFDRFATTIQGVELTFKENVDDAGRAVSANELVMRVRIHLGAASFASVGARLVLTEQPDGTWKIDVQLDEISGAIDVGDFHLRGTLAWSTESGASDPISSTAISTGANRDFWGEVALDTGGLIDASVLLRIGNRGELSYWIGAITVAELGFGPAATIKKPALLIAHHADFGGNLRTLLADVQTSIAAAVRPPEEGVSRAWLANWVPSADIGTVIAASGFLNVHDVIASAPDNPNADDFTCLVITDSGLFRAEATIMLFELARARVGLAVDLQRKRFTAGIQLPEFTYGNFTVRAGHIAFGLGWGDLYFLLSVGWPEAIGGDVMNRDWSKSVMVRWDGAFPLNTFMGGTRAEVTSGAFILGFALRAGWTAEYSVGGQVAGGEASLGVMVGGIVEVYFGRNEAPRLRAATAPRALLAAAREARTLVGELAAMASSDEPDPLLEVLQFAVPHVEALMPAMSELNITGRVLFFGDIWGKASVHLFGVTLAAIDVGAHAAFVGCIRFAPNLEVVRLAARVSMHLSVRIGCVTMSARADIDVTIRDLGVACFPSESRVPAALAAERKALA